MLKTQQTTKAPSFEILVRKASPNLSESAFTQLVELLTLVLKKISVNDFAVEAVEVSRARETVTLYIRGEEIEIGLKDGFGAPRRRASHFIKPRGNYFATYREEGPPDTVFGCLRVHPIRIG